MNDSDDDALPIPPKLYRTLSAAYIDPFTGEPSYIDPNSRACSPAEKKIREDAVLRDLPQTGYADGIREKRLKPIMFFGSCKEQAFSLKKNSNNEDDNNNNCNNDKAVENIIG